VNLVLVGAGLVAVVAGARLVLLAARALLRRAVFTARFWASMPAFAGYRLRALTPALAGLAGLLLLAAGAAAVFFGVTGYYFSTLRFR